MYVSSASSGAILAQYSRSKYGTSGNSSSQQANGPDGTPPNGPPPGGKPPAGGRPGLSDSDVSKIDDILKNGGSADDVEAQLKSQAQAFQSSDKFKSLPADVQQKIKDHSSDEQLSKTASRLVDRYKSTGTVKPTEHHHGRHARQLLAQLEQQGQGVQSALTAQRGAASSASTSSTSSSSASSSSTATVDPANDGDSDD